MSTELAGAQTQNIVPSQSPDRLIELAIEKGADVDNLSKLMDLKERWEATEAKKAFNMSLTKFQSKCPQMERTKKGHNCKYAPLSEIRRTVQPILEECGLTVTFTVEDGGKEDPIKVTCEVSHELGHSKCTTMSAYPDDSGNKNDIQSRGSTVSYLQRYTMIGALGITSADEDDDGQKSGGPIVNKIMNHTAFVRDNFHTIYMIKQSIADEDLSPGAEAWFELEEEEKKVAWLAPSKGGVFTTAELNTIKSTEFRKAHYG